MFCCCSSSFHETARNAKRHLQIYDMHTSIKSTPQTPNTPAVLCFCTRAYRTSGLPRGLDIAMDWEVISEQTLRHIEELLPPPRGPTVPSVDTPTPPRESSSGAEQKQSINDRAEGASRNLFPGSSTWKASCRYDIRVLLHNGVTGTWRYLRTESCEQYVIYKQDTYHPPKVVFVVEVTRAYRSIVAPNSSAFGTYCLYESRVGQSQFVPSGLWGGNIIK